MKKWESVEISFFFLLAGWPNIGAKREREREREREPTLHLSVGVVEEWIIKSSRARDQVIENISFCTTTFSHASFKRNDRWGRGGESNKQKKNEREKMKKKSRTLPNIRVVRDLLCVKKDIYKIIFRYFFSFFFLSSFLIGSQQLVLGVVDISAECLLPLATIVLSASDEREWVRAKHGGNIKSNTRRMRNPNTIEHISEHPKRKIYVAVFMLVFQVYSLVSRSPARFTLLSARVYYYLSILLHLLYKYDKKSLRLVSFYFFLLFFCFLEYGFGKKRKHDWRTRWNTRSGPRWGKDKQAVVWGTKYRVFVGRFELVLLRFRACFVRPSSLHD